MRLIAAAIMMLTGMIGVSLRTLPGTSEEMGSILVPGALFWVGLVLFVVEYVREWRGRDR